MGPTNLAHIARTVVCALMLMSATREAPCDDSGSTSHPATSRSAEAVRPIRVPGRLEVRREWLEQRPRLLLSPERLGHLRENIDRYGTKGWWRPSEPWPDGRAPNNLDGKWRRLVESMPDFALTYLLTEDEGTLSKVEHLVEMLVELDHWGQDYRPGVDIQASFALFGAAITYDWLYDDLDPDLRNRLRDSLAAQARCMYGPAKGGWIWWAKHPEGNHFYLNATALLFAALALYEEVEDAPQWAYVARERLRQTLGVWPKDEQGDFWEGTSYWDFSVRRLIRGVALLDQATGEDLIGDNPWFAATAYWRWHMTDHVNGINLIFGDQRREASTAAETLAYLARRYGDRVVQDMAEDAAVGREGALFAVWHDDAMTSDSAMKAVPLEGLFDNTGAVVLRSSWIEPDQTVFGFTCAPVGGHHLVGLRKAGFTPLGAHSHPDANAFVIVRGGQYLAADDGYCALKETANHCTLLVDGKGQIGSGQRWPKVVAERTATLGPTALSPRISLLVGDAGGAYPHAEDLRRFRRRIVSFGRRWFVVCDDLQADRPHRYTWVLFADRPPVTLGDGRAIVTRGQSRLHVRWLQPEVQLRVVPAGIDRFQGFPRLPEPVRILAEPQAGSVRSVRFVTVLVPSGDDEASPRMQSIRKDGCEAVLRREGRTTELAVFARDDAPWRVNVLSGNGLAAAVRLMNGRPIAWAGQEIQQLSVDGQSVLDCDGPLTIALSGVDRGWEGMVNCEGRRELSVYCPSIPADVSLAGRQVDFAYAPGDQQLVLRIPPGRHRLTVQHEVPKD